MVRHPQPHALMGSTVPTCWWQSAELSPRGFPHSEEPLEVTLFFLPAFFPPHVFKTCFPTGAHGSAQQDRAARERQISCTGKGTLLPLDTRLGKGKNADAADAGPFQLHYSGFTTPCPPLRFISGQKTGKCQM